MATHFSILAWRILWTEEPGWLQSIGHKESDRTEATEQTAHNNPLLNKSKITSKWFNCSQYHSMSCVLLIFPLNNRSPYS